MLKGSDDFTGADDVRLRPESICLFTFANVLDCPGDSSGSSSGDSRNFLPNLPPDPGYAGLGPRFFELLCEGLGLSSELWTLTATRVKGVNPVP